MKPRISQQEFKERVTRTQIEMKKENLDLLLCFSNEAEPQFVRYYSNYWPSFEFAGLLIPQQGDAILLIGPESMTYAKHVSSIQIIRRLLAFRESSNPDYPGADLDTYASILKNDLDLESVNKVGIAGYGLITHQIYEDFETAMSDLGAKEIVNADDVVSKIRIEKSPMEIACLKEAYRIASVAMNKVIEKIKVGMTENEVKGIALERILAEGAEAEGYPFWILTGEDSNQAVSRVRNKVIQAGDLVQAQVAARYEGYVASIGRPIVMGKATPEQKALVEAGYTVQERMLEAIKPGVEAKAISDLHYNTLNELGFADHILYGPAHGTGLMENEHPWVESNSEYQFRENMTFCTCLYLGNDEKKIGIRVEDGFVINSDGVEVFGNAKNGLIEII
ncbi:MAG TPA: aminopeptidase P family protein [Clostridiaceae bacterium]|nr:aminopeptidase P family protein [Clostridiaceae bacterium]